MNTTIETNEQPIKETWIKVVFALPNPYSDKRLWVDTSRLTLNNKNLDSSLRDTLSKLNDIKNMCVTKPKEYAEKYGKSLLSVVKEMFPDSKKHMLKVWSLEQERHAKENIIVILAIIISLTSILTPKATSIIAPHSTNTESIISAIHTLNSSCSIFIVYSLFIGSLYYILVKTSQDVSLVLTISQ